MNQKSIIAILGVVIIVLIGTTVYFAMTKNVSQPVATTSNVVQQPVPSPAAQLPSQPATNQQSATQPTNDTASWQTYKNEKYGFEVKFPESYSEFHKSGNSSITLRSTETCKSLLNGGGEWPADCQSYGILVQQNGISIAGGDTSKTFVAGIQAEKFTDSNGMWIDGTQILVQFQKGQNWYIQTFTFNQGKSQIAEGVMNQILSTFKFTK